MTKPKTRATSATRTIPKRRMLEVEDADSIGEFLKKARTVWRNKHGAKIKRRGRPSFLMNIFNAIEQAEKDGKIGKKPSQGKIIRLVQEYLGTSAPSQDTIRRYVKVWHMAKFKGFGGLDLDDEVWLGEKDLMILFYEFLE